ncbi:MAG: M23 family metallopeptidase [Candidatus Rokubacteria bacterium]|nr:M23 family metallopeptidase [Candidatus Rokubacteria bacterium]
MRGLRSLPIVLLVSAAVTGLVTPTHELPPPALAVVETVLEPGETVEAVLLRTRLERPEIAAIVGALSRGVDMRRVQPGERLLVTRAPDGRLLDVTYRRTLVERYEVRQESAGWRAHRVLTPVETRIAAVAGTLEGSLFASMDRLDESPALTAKFVNLFEWDFDFAADSLPGDRFRLLVEKQHARGDFVGYGDILIAQYQSVGRRTLTAVAFPGAGGKSSYFDAEGRSVRKMFLRAPLDFTRITSGYSHARRHPILGGVRPHLAIDYGAPAGTPVRAVADGVVQASGWNGGNGLSITLRHARGYKTMYNHLAAVNVRPGQRVRQRQVIGRVGSTGLSTGPHLDYRVIKHGRYVNPLGERFVPGSPVPPERRTAFGRHLEGLLERLDHEVPFEPRA